MTANALRALLSKVAAMPPDDYDDLLRLLQEARRPDLKLRELESMVSAAHELFNVHTFPARPFVFEDR